MDEKTLALEAIRKKLVGKELTYREIYAIMDQISRDRLGDVLTTYFVASGYSKGFTDEEIYYLTRAMVETGEKLHFRGLVADKHSIGGTPGTRTTMIVVPIIAAAGIRVPKSSSRAITTPAGTADAMETIAKVTFTKEEIYHIIEETNGCIVWGGSFKIAPADDEIIRIEEPLLFESYDKILVSVMAKKIAFGSTNVVIDLPYGRTVKLLNLVDAQELGRKFKLLARRFKIKLESFIHEVDEPAGAGIGPLLEAKDALKVLEQSEDRPRVLEERSIFLASMLLKLCLEDLPEKAKQEYHQKYKNTREWVEKLLRSGEAHRKMMEIVYAQKGKKNILSADLKPAAHHKMAVAASSGIVEYVNNKNITILAKLLGAPQESTAGLLLHRRIGDHVSRGDEMATFYSESRYKLSETIESLSLFPIYTLKK